MKHKIGRPRALSYADDFFLTLVKLRLYFPVEDLWVRFGLSSSSQVSAILKTWINFLSCELGPYIAWPDRDAVRKNLPQAFQNEKYKDVVGVIDCSEFEIQAPTSFSLKGMAYSDYKSRNTFKALFCITPDGMFSLDLYPGSKSDNDLTMTCGILDGCQPGDALMADKGFTITDTELHRRGVRLIRHSFFPRTSGHPRQRCSIQRKWRIQEFTWRTPLAV